MGTSPALLEILQLDPERDYQRICYLTARQDFPLEWIASLEIGLLKAFCIPALSEIMLQSGQVTGRSVSRHGTTVATFLSYVEYGINSPDGREALRFTNRQHRPYDIANEAYLYAMAAAWIEPFRMVQAYGWRQIHQKEREAFFFFWRDMARYMNVTNFFSSIEELEEYCEEFEKREFRFAPVNQTLGDALMAGSLVGFSRLARPFIRLFKLSLLEDSVLMALGWTRPHRAIVGLFRGLLLLRKRILQVLPPPARPQRLSDMRSPTYPDGYTIQRAVERTPPSKPIESPAVPQTT